MIKRIMYLLRWIINGTPIVDISTEHRKKILGTVSKFLSTNSPWTDLHR